MARHSSLCINLSGKYFYRLPARVQVQVEGTPLQCVLKGQGQCQQTATIVNINKSAGEKLQSMALFMMPSSTCRRLFQMSNPLAPQQENRIGKRARRTFKWKWRGNAKDNDGRRRRGWRVFSFQLWSWWPPGRLSLTEMTFPWSWHRQRKRKFKNRPNGRAKRANNWRMLIKMGSGRRTVDLLRLVISRKKVASLSSI